MSADDWTSLIEHALWPTVVVVLGLALRKPIAAFFAALAERVTRVSVLSVSVELAEARSADPPWRGIGGDDVRGLVVAQQVNDSYFSTLREALRSLDSADYMVVDLRSDGEDWLTSRLYLFSYLLGQLKRIRAVVFVATRGDVARSFLAVAPVDAVLRALATAQPWLREARMESEANQVGRLPNPPIPPPNPVATTPTNIPLEVDDWWAAVRDGTIYGDSLSVAQQYLERIQWQQSPGQPDPGDGWLRLPDRPSQLATWEHATWLRSSDLTDGTLRNGVQPDWCLVDDRSWTAEERVRAVAAVPGEFVALLTPSHRFDRLIDRASLLARLGQEYASSSSS